MAIKYRCKTYMCKGLAIDGRGYCQACLDKYKPAVNTKSRDEYPRTERPTPQESGYDWRWRQFSKKFLARNPRCAICGAPSEVTDHIIPASVMMEAYGKFDYDERNYQALCQRCNKRKGMREDKKFKAQFRKEMETLS